ncbi:MAG TPA: dicarboxylate/amino acid:cation symporter [Dongiaceae bacterium]|nr:dicarboxylate/amino acid:cation symporter [Dongiaceae bacterium]
MSRATPLHTRILIGMLTGASLGIAAHFLWGDSEWLRGLVDNVTIPAGKIFLRLIMMVVIPLVMSALILGVAELGDPRRLGRVGLRTLMFTILLSSISVLVGVGAANLVRPGEGLSEETRAALMQVIRSSAGTIAPPPAPKSGLQIVLDLIPENPVEAMTRAFQGDMIAVMVFALTLGIALTTIDRPTADPLLRWLQALFDTVMKVIDFAMRLAPYGVGALLFSLTARFGLEVLRLLAVYVFTVLAALLFHQVVTYSIVVRVFGGMSPTFFFTRIKEVMLTAFSTSSSNATLPTTLRVAEKELGVPRPIGHFVLTLGSTLNQNGTALYEGITVIFLAQFFGVPLTLGGQVTVALLSILAGVGTAGVPGDSLPLVTALLVTVGVPAEGIAIILGVDRILDMCRTVLNVTGDVAVAVCVAKSEAAEAQVDGAAA